MSLTTKNVILRLIVICTFLSGVIFIVNIVSFARQMESMPPLEKFTDEDDPQEIIAAAQEEVDFFVNSFQTLEMNYYIYLAGSVIAFVLSIVFSKVTSTVITVIRSFFLGIGAVSVGAGFPFISIFIIMRKHLQGMDFVNMERHDQISSLSGMLDNINTETLTIAFLLFLLSFLLFFILAVTSVVGLLIKPRDPDKIENHW